MRIKLTARIFILIAALLVGACGATYGAISYLTPMSYTAMMEDELAARAVPLVIALSKATLDGAQPLLRDFALEHGTDIRISDPRGHAIYTSGADMEITPRRAYSFHFSDGRPAVMHIAGGMKGTNRAAQALRQIFPMLIALILLMALGGAILCSYLITRPVVQISRIAKRIADRDFQARWGGRRSDEIGELGDSLNLLSDNLSRALSDLQGEIGRERELFSAVSHELKTPITILKGQLEGMIGNIGIYKDRDAYLPRALGATERMEALVNEILSVARLESGSEAMQMADVELGALMRAQLFALHELIERRGMDVHAQIEQTQVPGDARLLAKAMSNVLLNAILYSPEGARIDIKVGGGGFSVINHGAQLPDGAQDGLFEPFSRLEKSRNRQTGGSGLGLYLVKRILDGHGADFGIGNEGDGVRFWAAF